jgi:hypothetical protein
MNKRTDLHTGSDCQLIDKLEPSCFLHRFEATTAFGLEDTLTHTPSQIGFAPILFLVKKLWAQIVSVNGFSTEMEQIRVMLGQSTLHLVWLVRGTSTASHALFQVTHMRC